VDGRHSVAFDHVFASTGATGYNLQPEPRNRLRDLRNNNNNFHSKQCERWRLAGVSVDALRA